MRKNEEKLEIQNILSKELLDKKPFEEIPHQLKLIKKYPLVSPFSYANILYDEKNSNFLYHVDEIKLNHEEERIYRGLYSFVEQSLDSLEPTESKDFDSHLDNVIKKHEGFFISSSLASMEKVKYFLRRDISGFSKIDSLMHDQNIEDISCSGPNLPLYNSSFVIGDIFSISCSHFDLVVPNSIC